MRDEYSIGHNLKHFLLRFAVMAISPHCAIVTFAATYPANVS